VVSGVAWTQPPTSARAEVVLTLTSPNWSLPSAPAEVVLALGVFGNIFSSRGH
jgi:hypothetical protein